VEATSTVSQPIEMMLDPDPRRGDKARNADRVVCRIVVASGSGCTIEGRYLPKGEHFVVIYADRFEEVRKRVRTQAQMAALADAERMAAADVEEWIEEKLGKDLGEAQRVLLREQLQRQCPISPYQNVYLVRAGRLHQVNLKTGIPPLESAEIVAEWTRPVTPETSTANAIEQLASTMSRIIERGAETKAKQAKAEPKT
jgi:hypothetical protein